MKGPCHTHLIDLARGERSKEVPMPTHIRHAHWRIPEWIIQLRTGDRNGK